MSLETQLIFFISFVQKQPKPEQVKELIRITGTKRYLDGLWDDIWPSFSTDQKKLPSKKNAKSDHFLFTC